LFIQCKTFIKCCKQTIFTNRTVQFCRIHFLFQFGPFFLFFCKFTQMPQILIQLLSLFFRKKLRSILFVIFHCYLSIHSENNKILYF
jgi:hypothetical protein